MGKHEEKSVDFIDIYSSAKKSKKRKKSKKNKIIITILSVLLAFCVVVTGLLAFALNYFKYNKTEVDEDNLGVNSEDSEDHIKNIALFGIDTRDGESLSGLSDSIMVMSVDTDKKTIKLISVMRDSVVLIDGKAAKINSAYSKGKAELAIKTLNLNFSLDITDYATVNFSGMADLIDAVGGIEVEVTQREIDNKKYGLNMAIAEQAEALGIKNYEKEYVKTPGKQLLNGLQAVAWARIRHEPTAWGEYDDYGRTARQRYVLNELFKKAKDMSVLKYPGFIKKMLPLVETSLTEKEILRLATTVISGGTLDTSARIPYDGCVISGENGGVTGGVYYNLDYATSMIKAFIYEDISFENYVELNEIDKTPWN